MFVAKRNFPETSFAQFHAFGAWSGPSLCLVISQWQNHAKCIKTQVLGLIKWIKHVYCNKISRKFVRTVSCIRSTNRTQIVTTVLTVAKSCETHQNTSFGSNKVDKACLLQQNLQKVCSHSFVHPVHEPNTDRNYYRFNSGKIMRNASKHQFWL